MPTQMVNDHETPRGKKNSGFLSVWTCFPLGGQILFLALALLSPPVPLLVAQTAAVYASGSSSAGLFSFEVSFRFSFNEDQLVINHALLFT